MKILKTLIVCIVTALSLSLTGCFPYYAPPASGTYVFSYIIPDTIELKKFLSKNNTPYFDITFSGTKIEGSKKVKKIGEKYGDTNYKEKISPGTPSAVDEIFLKIDVISDADFNEYPAGTSLAKITRFHGASPYPFISSGYKATYNWSSVQEGWEDIFNTEGSHLDNGYSPVNDMLSNLNEQNLIMLHPTFSTIRFTETPEIKVHTFTVTFYAADTEYSSQITIDFGQEANEE